jgi:hypothetical protein
LDGRKEEMRRVLALSALALLLVGSARVSGSDAGSAEARLAKARQILELTGSGNLGVQIVAQTLPALRQMAPQAPESFWTEYMAEIKPEGFIDLVAPVYAKHFEEAELDALIEFYASPVGKKTIEKLPLITAESMAAGQVWGESIAKRAIEKLKAAGIQPNA